MDQQQLISQHRQQQQQQAQHQQQQQQQQQNQQQFLLLQQLQKQVLQNQQHQHHHHHHQQQLSQSSATTRFPSNIDAHLRTTPGLHHRPLNLQQPQQSPNPNSNPNPSLQQQQLMQKGMRPPPPVNQTELQLAYQDAWRVCHPDFKRPFTSLEDACERLLPYHVVADYEAEEDDRILDSDTTGQMPSRSQQWDHNIEAKVAEFTATFEKQALAFNIISHKRSIGEFRSEERLLIEQALLQEEKKMLVDLKTEMDKAGRDAHLRMAAMVQVEQVGAGMQGHGDIMTRAPIRGRALGSQAHTVRMGHDMGEQASCVNPDDMMNEWGTNTEREDKEPSEDFLNDEETENSDPGVQDESREAGEFDLNMR